MATPSGQQAPVSFFDGEFRDFDELAEAIEGWDLDWEQLDRGRLEAKLQQIHTSSALLSRVHFSRQFHQRGGSPSGFLTFGILRDGTAEVNWCGRGASSRDLLAFPTGGEYESMSQPGFSANTLSFSEDLLDRLARSLDLPKMKDLLSGSDQLIATAPGAMTEIRETLRSVFNSAGAEPAVLLRTDFRRQLEVEIPTLLLKAIGPREKTGRMLSSVGRSRVARRAVALIAERADVPLTVQQLCADLETSERTLQYAFREQFDVTPKQYLQSVRLNGVRKDLRRSGSTTRIADVANRWGFWHLGQFANDYRRHFGELPSETLSRA